jgi:hypothetical protein
VFLLEYFTTKTPRRREEFYPQITQMDTDGRHREKKSEAVLPSWFSLSA